MKQRGVFLIGLILVAVYYFFCPRESGKELVISPDYLTKPDFVNSTKASAVKPALVTRNKNKVAYLDQDHHIQAVFSSERMAVDRNWIAVSGNDGLSLMEPNSRLITRIPDSAYPVNRNGNLFLYRNQTGKLSKIDTATGKVLWNREYISELTVLDGSSGHTLVGMLDGRIEVIDDSGNIILKYRPGGSRIESIYAGTLSRDGSKIALISGLDPQRFILLGERKNGYRPIEHHNTGTDFRRSISIEFMRNDRQVLYENQGYVDSVSLNDFAVHPLELSGRFITGIDSLVRDTLLLFGKDNEKASIKMLSRHDLPVFESLLPVGTSEVVRDRNYLCIVDENNISFLEFSVR